MIATDARIHRSTPSVVVLRGALAVGKSTLGKRLVEALSPCAYIEIDRLRKMPSDGDLSARHLTLAKRNACLLARSFLAEGYSVVLDSVFEHACYVELVRSELAVTGAPLHLITLEAPLAELVARDAGKRSPNFERVADVNQRLASLHLPHGARLFTGGLNPDQVEREALELIASGRARVS